MNECMEEKEMKLRKILASVAAAALAATTMVTIASAESYNAYIGFQDTVYSFRNAWTEANYGKATDYFDKAIVWGGNDPESFPEYEDSYDYDIEGYAIDVDYTDAVIDGDGTYTVAIDGFPWELDSASSFNLLFISTDIPLDSGATISSASIIVDGAVAATYDEPMQNPDDKSYVCPLFANIWNSDLESYAGAYPTESLAIEFTVTGLGGGAEDTAADDTATDDTAADDTATDDTADTTADTTTDDTADTTTGDKTTPDTGVEGVAAVAGLAIVAAGAVIVAKKRK